jgi:hypothetical protein
VILASNETTAGARFSVAFMKFVRLHNQRKGDTNFDITRVYALRIRNRDAEATKLRNLFGKFDTGEGSAAPRCDPDGGWAISKTFEKARNDTK